MSSYQPKYLRSGFGTLHDTGSPSSYGHKGLTPEEAYRRGRQPFREMVYHGHVPKFVKKLKAREDLKRKRPGHTDGTLEANETLRRHQEVCRATHKTSHLSHHLSLTIGGLANDC